MGHFFLFLKNFIKKWLSESRKPRKLAIFSKLHYNNSVRRKYDIKVLINDQFVTKAIIDPHYEEKHGESINDEIILQLIQKLDGKSFEPDDVKENFSYFATDGIILSDKSYKLIWLLEENEIYIGVVNAYRRS